MDISRFTVEDFVLNPEFRIWLLRPEKSANIQWGRLLRQNPRQLSNAKLARKIVLNMTHQRQKLSDGEICQLWENIDAEVDDLESETDRFIRNQTALSGPTFKLKTTAFSSNILLERYQKFNVKMSMENSIRSVLTA